MCEKGPKENSILIKTGQFLIGISSRKHKVVKFIDSERGISTLKIITLPVKNELGMLFKQQIQHVKQYLLRRYQLSSQLKLTPYLEMQQVESTNNVLKIITKFSEYPTLLDYYRQQNIQASTNLKFKLYNNEDGNALVYFFEELFELIVRAGGITYYFYTPTNFFYMPPSPDSGLEPGKLTLNLASTVGIKFIFEHQVPKDEFIQIYPCLPPNIHSLIAEKAYDKLDVLIKIRSLAFNMLAYVLKRVPTFFEQNLDPMVSIHDFQIKNLIKKSPNTFQLLLRLEANKIKQASESTKIALHDLFTKVLVENTIYSWKEVHEMVFLKNFFNESDFEKVNRGVGQKDQALITQHLFSERMLRQIWEVEENKEFYNRRAIGEKQLKVYLLVKVNCSFHRPLRWLNILQYCQYQHFGEESAKIASKLMQIFTSTNFQSLNSDLLGVSPQQFRKELAQRGQIRKGSEQIATPSEKDVVSDPFAVSWFSECKNEEVMRSGPSIFLRNLYTLSSISNVGNKSYMITSINHKLEAVSKFQNQMWLF